MLFFALLPLLTARKMEISKMKKELGDIIIYSPFISSVWRRERDSLITKASEAIAIRVEVSQNKASKRIREASC